MPVCAGNTFRPVRVFWNRCQTPLLHLHHYRSLATPAVRRPPCLTSYPRPPAGTRENPVANSSLHAQLSGNAFSRRPDHYSPALDHQRHLLPSPRTASVPNLFCASPESSPGEVVEAQSCLISRPGFTRTDLPPESSQRPRYFGTVPVDRLLEGTISSGTSPASRSPGVCRRLSRARDLPHRSLPPGPSTLFYIQLDACAGPCAVTPLISSHFPVHILHTHISDS